jgi:hypothetical protein
MTLAVALAVIAAVELGATFRVMYLTDHGRHRPTSVRARRRQVRARRISVRVHQPAPLRVRSMPNPESDDVLLDGIAARTGPRFLAALIDTVTRPETAR